MRPKNQENVYLKINEIKLDTYIPGPQIKNNPKSNSNISAPSKPITPKLLQSLSYISGRKCSRSYCHGKFFGIVIEI